MSFLTFGLWPTAECGEISGALTPHYSPCLVLNDERARPRRTGFLWFSQPQRLLLRWLRDCQCKRCSSRAGLGHPIPSRQEGYLLRRSQTYPVKPINGCIVSDFLTPSTKHEYTYPRELKEEIERVANGYVLDVDNFRTDDKEDLLRRDIRENGKTF